MKRDPGNAPYAASLLMLALLFGCSKHEAPPAAPAQKKVAQAKPARPVQIQLSSAVKPGTQLDFKKRTDPFKPFVPAVVSPAPGAGHAGQRLRPAEDLLPIQAFETSRFRVVGIITGLNESRALVIDPNGKGYTLKQGMLIGNNGGRVSRITPSSVEVIEKIREENGRLKKRTIVLTLARKR